MIRFTSPSGNDAVKCARSLGGHDTWWHSLMISTLTAEIAVMGRARMWKMERGKRKVSEGER